MSHVMTITNGVPSFTCTAPVDATCHEYPDCECEQWSEEHENDHPNVAQPECWLSLWFTPGTGETREMYVGGDEMPESAAGEIEIDFDECPLWSFVDLDAALNHENGGRS